MRTKKGYRNGMVEPKIHHDALLLTVVKDFTTANGIFGGSAVATFMATEPAPQWQRSDNAHHT
jgi:hypothetical protein